MGKRKPFRKIASVPEIAEPQEESPMKEQIQEHDLSAELSPVEAPAPVAVDENEHENVDGDGAPQEEAPQALTDEQAEALLKAEEIQDPGSVFRLAYLEERKRNGYISRELRKRIYDERLMALKNERNDVIAAIDRELAHVEELLIQARAEIEAKHDLNLKNYAYDDETGVLRKVTDDAKPGATDSQ